MTKRRPDRRIHLFFLAWWCIAGLGLGGTPPDVAQEDQDTPGPLVIRINTCDLDVLSRELEAMLVRFASGEITDPAGSLLPIRVPDKLREQAHDAAQQVAGANPGKVRLLLATYLKIPVARLNQFLPRGGGMQVLIFAPRKQGAAYRVGLYLPLARLDELVSVWQSDDVVKLLVDKDEEDVHSITHPRFGDLFLKSAPPAGVAVSRTRATVLALAERAREWERAPLRKGPQVQVTFDIPRLLAAGWLEATPPKGMAPMLRGHPIYPPYATLLFQLPQAVTRSGVLDWQQAERVDLDVYFTPNSLLLDARCLPAKGSALATRLQALEAPRGSTDLLAAMPRETVSFLTLPAATEVISTVRAFLATAMLGHLEPGQAPDDLITHLILKKTQETMRGEACAAYVRGSLGELNLLLSFRAADAASAGSYVAAVARHVGTLASVTHEGNVVCFAFGLQHKKLLATLREDLRGGTAPLGQRIKELDWMNRIPGRHLALAGVYPVDLCKSLIGLMFTMARVYGPAVGPADFRKAVLGPIKDSPHPILASAAEVEGVLTLTLSVPVGAYMDVGRLLQRFAFAWIEQQPKASENWLNTVLEKRLMDYIRQTLGVKPPPITFDRGQKTTPQAEETPKTAPARR